MTIIGYVKNDGQFKDMVTGLEIRKNNNSPDIDKSIIYKDLRGIENGLRNGSLKVLQDDGNVFSHITNVIC